MSHRPTVYGTRHAVSAGHYLAAAAGFSILEAGGNAIDAGCAAGIALGVLQPDLVNVAGVAPIMIRLRERPRWRASPASASGRRRLPADLFMREHGGKIPDGVLRTVVPAAPDAWITALRRHGTMRFADVASSAIRYAGEGFAVYPLLADLDRGARGRISALAVQRRDLPARRPGAEVGRQVRAVRPRRARCSTWPTRTAPPGRTATAGLRAAHDAFYRGDIAREIVRFQQQEGGYLSLDDLAEYHSPHRAGGAAAVARPRGDHLRPVVPGPGAAARRWRCSSASASPGWRTTRADLPAPHRRMREPGDGGPRVSLRRSGVRRCADRPPARSGDHRAARRARCATTARSARCRRRWTRTNRPHRGAARREMPKVEADTSYCCVVDRWGNAFSATPSDGSRQCAGGAGPGHHAVGPRFAEPARSAPSRRRGARQAAAADAQPGDGGDRGRRVMPFGTPGGDVQTQAMLQVLLNIFHFGMEVQDAIEAPRVASYSFPSSFAPFEYFPGRLAVEGRIDAAVRADLAARGHDVKAWPDWTWLAGSVEAVLRDPVSGLIAAGADPRRPAYAIAI